MLKLNSLLKTNRPKEHSEICLYDDRVIIENIKLNKKAHLIFHEYHKLCVEQLFCPTLDDG